MIIETIRTLGPWSWLIGGLILLGVEVLAPGAFFLWFGIAALIVGVAAFVMVLSWQLQAIAFVVLAVLLALAGRRVYGRRSGGQAFLNDRAARLVGGIYPLTEAISHGSGRIRVGDSTWSVSGPELPSGARVRVTGYDGSVLRVAAE